TIPSGCGRPTVAMSVKAALKEVLGDQRIARLTDARRRYRTWRKRRHRRVGIVRLGSLRRVRPIRPGFGCGWGRCVDRYYIEAFLASHASDIHGAVLEACDSTYTRRFGGDRVTRAEV